MSKSFKVDRDTLEDTQKVKRYGNAIRKLQARKKVQERRNERRRVDQLAHAQQDE